MLFTKEKHKLNLARQERKKDFHSQFTALADDLIAANYLFALKALFFALQHGNKGFRKDGISPSGLHFVEVAQDLCDRRRRLVAAGFDADYILALGILHDIIEDNPELKGVLEKEFGCKMVKDCQSQDKHYVVSEELAKTYRSPCLNGFFTTSRLKKWKERGYNPQPLYETLFNYYIRFYNDPKLMIVKMEDRLNNLPTLMNLPPDKRAEYVLETKMLMWLAQEICKERQKTDRNLVDVLQPLRKRLRDILKPFLHLAEEAASGQATQTLSALTTRGIISSPSLSPPLNCQPL